MALTRTYTAPISIAAHTAQVDVFELLTAAGKPVELLCVEFGQSTELGDAQDEVIPLVLKRVTGAPTSGSGGSAPTFVPVNPNDTAAGVTLEIGNTTKLTGGTSTELARFSWNVRAGFLYLPIEEVRIVVDAATRLVLEEVGTPTDSITGPIGRIVVRELV
jgi:hypothetical protein